MIEPSSSRTRRFHVLRDELDDLVGDGQLEVVEAGLLLQDGDAVLEVGRIDVRDHAPLEAGDEAGLESGDLLGRPVGGEHDLPAGLVDGVERVEELFLRGLLALEELDVVHQQQVDFAVAAAELAHLAGLDGGDELVGELLGADVREAERRGAAQQLVGDGLHEVRLAESGVAVDEERVVDLAGRLGGGLSGGGGDVVGLADDELVERVARVKWR